MTRKASNDNATPRTPKTMHERGPYVEVDLSAFDQIKNEAIRNGNYPTTTASEPLNHLKNFCKEETLTFATGYSEFYFAVKAIAEEYYKQLINDKPILFNQIWENRIKEVELIKNELAKNAQHGFNDMSLYWLCTVIANQELNTFFGRRYLPEELKKIIYRVSCNELYINSFGTYNYEQLNKSFTEAQVELVKEKTARSQADKGVEIRDLEISELRNDLGEAIEQKVNYFNANEILRAASREKDRIIKRKDTEIKELKSTTEKLQNKIDDLESENETLRDKVNNLETRLAVIESLLSNTSQKANNGNNRDNNTSPSKPDWSKIHQTGSPIHSASQNHQSGLEPGPTHEKYVFQANSHI